MNKEMLGKILMLWLAFLVFAFSIFIFYQYEQKKPQSASEDTAAQTPTPTPGPSRPISKWATDSAILQIEEELKSVSDSVDNVDLKESGLFPPLLDMQVKF
ncbi:MAG: hypothetical protein Q7S03_00355 [bacterium]|nr:hypothetical protein [bacterium]